MLRFTDEHEWLRLDGDVATVGITAHAAEQLGDLVFVELPKVGVKLTKGEAAAVVESVKAASDIYAPVDGEIVAFNEALNDQPNLINEAAHDTWIFKIKPKNPADLDNLLDAAGYEASL